MTLRVTPVSAPVQALEAQGRQVDRVDRHGRLEVRLDVPGVHTDHDDHDAVGQERVFGRDEGRADGDRVSDEEVTDVHAQDVGIDGHLAAGGAPARPGDHAAARAEN